MGALGIGAVAVAGYQLRGEAESADIQRPEASTGKNPVVDENTATGSQEWVAGHDGTVAANDKAAQIQGYASTTSAGPGESIDFHLWSHTAQACTVAIYRLGHYGGQGARHLVTSDPVDVEARTRPEADAATGLIACDWPVSWTLEIPETWVSGLHLAVFTSDDGFRSYTPFVIREPKRRSDVLMVIPFTTYQAYNMWPSDGRIGKNLYKGFTPDGKIGGNPERAFQVSFDRPYAHVGLPSWFEMDTSAVRWAEEAGYDVTYASSVDLHEGLLDASRYTAIIFSGHDEYWSKDMRDWAEEAVAAGTHLAFFGSNNIYFHIRVEASGDDRQSRVVTCYKQDEDPDPGAGGATERWRTIGKKHRQAEQGLLGVQYNGMPAQPVPLVVRESKHWFWAGTGLRDDDQIPDLIAVEADGFDDSMPRPENAEQTLLSESPYSDRMGRGRRIQNTSLCQDGAGTLVFVAGTFHWPLALSAPEHVNTQIQRATTNLMTKMLTGRSS
ncbi:N,N-dimethylformamidase beta subunit family domain-containing protein [Streptomyces sp. NPDC048142]|uniref:N,N-dimethylformamidase beta subunit family domain-containing protein n=1 Tax=Streptomyces sp. NPDC048142 TaxID=3365501 RepID=UPI0037167A6A